MTHGSGSAGSSDRDRTVTELALEYLRRIESGERITDDEIAGSHVDLMPDLGHALRKLRVIRSARARAGSSVASESDHGEDSWTQPDAARPPPLFPGYALANEAHRGGQGVVYRALQSTTNREVAIKVIRDGLFAGPRDLGRFEREVQLLSKMRHPGIVTIHDSGSIDGRLFFVMDWVEGQPLDEHVAAGKLGIRAILTLVANVADAVNAAHLRGIIHRDLKPANIRVDEEGKPRVLDFGLATTEQPTDAEAGPKTVTGQFVGSMPWASPEQARGRAQTLDIRSDVYSLGVILYQLLTGDFPYEVIGPARDVLDRIADAEPLRPRARRPEIGDEVETIVLRCLSKDPERRYQSAGDLARDIRRYLAGEPIEAKRDSTWYVVRKVAQRHWPVVTVAIAFLVLVTVFTASLLVLYGRALRAEARAAEERRTALAEAETAQHLVASLGTLFHSLDPRRTGRGDLTLIEVIDVGVADTLAELEDRPAVEMQVRAFVAEAYESHGHHARAVPHRRRILELRRATPDAPTEAVATAHYEFATALFHAGDFEAAEPEFFAAVQLASAEAPTMRRVAATYESGYAMMLQGRGRYVEARELFERTVTTYRELFGPEHPQTAQSLHNLAWLLQAQGELEEAATMMRDALVIRRRTLGPDDLRTADTAFQLASIARRLGRLDEAERLYRGAIDVRRGGLGRRHPDVATSFHGLGTLLKDLARFEEAEILYREALGIRREVLGPAHPDTLITASNLAVLLEVTGRYRKAEEMEREVLARRVEHYGEDHLVVAMSHHNLGRLLRRLERVDEAAEHFERALAIRRRVPRLPDTATTLRELAAIRASRGAQDEAIELLEEALEILEMRFGRGHRSIADTLNTVASLRGRAGDVDGAIDAMREAIAIYREQLGEDHLSVGVALGNLATMLAQRGEYEEAEATYREALHIYELAYPESGDRTAELQSRFGRLLTETGAYDEAWALLTEAHRVLLETLGPQHRLTRLAAERLGDVAEARRREVDG